MTDCGSVRVMISGAGATCRWGRESPAWAGEKRNGLIAGIAAGHGPIADDAIQAKRAALPVAPAERAAPARQQELSPGPGAGGAGWPIRPRGG